MVLHRITFLTIKHGGDFLYMEDCNILFVDLEERFGGNEAFQLALEQNKTSREELRSQLTIQVLIEKLLADEIKVTGKELAKYKKENKEFIGDMSDKQIEETVKSQKLNEAFTPWFEKVKDKANITTYF